MAEDLRPHLAYIRKQRGYSLRKLAELTGMNISDLSQIERCQYQPQINTFQKILDALGAELTIRMRDDD